MEPTHRDSVPFRPVPELHQEEYLARERELAALRREERELEEFVSRYENSLSRLQGLQRETASIRQRLNGWRRYVGANIAQQVDQLVAQYDAYKAQASPMGGFGGDFYNDILAGGSADPQQRDFASRIDSLRNDEYSSEPLFERQRPALEGSLHLLQKEQRALHQYIAQYDAKHERLLAVRAQAEALSAYLNDWRNGTNEKRVDSTAGRSALPAPHDVVADEIDGYLTASRRAADAKEEGALRDRYDAALGELLEADQEYMGIGGPPPGEAYRPRLDDVSARLQAVRQRLGS